ncbi:hypothetical protein GWI34_20675 [Actinomadura sp. DSM 109109]|nr:hypothetical protein [Actinomadura lepetitiana]
MDNTYTGSPMIGPPPSWPVPGGSAPVLMITGALPIIEACNYPGHVPFPCPVCGVPYCTLCDSHGCE